MDDTVDLSHSTAVARVEIFFITSPFCKVNFAVDVLITSCTYCLLRFSQVLTNFDNVHFQHGRAFVSGKSCSRFCNH